MADFSGWATDLFQWILALSLTGSIVFLCARLFEKPMIRCLKKSWIYNGYRFLLTLWVIPYGCMIWNVMGNTVHRKAVYTVAYHMLESAVSAQKKYEIPQELYSNDSASVLSIALSIISALWFLGMCFFFLHFLISYQNQKRCLQKRAVETLWIEEWNRNVCMKDKIGKHTKILMNPDISSPLLLGLWRHTILIPDLILDECEMEMILRHEWIHMRRKDNILLWITQMIRCIHWFNPLVYLFQREIGRFCEDSCDEQMIAHMNDNQRKQYGLTIVKVLEQTANSADRNVKAISAFNSSYKRIEERIRNIVVRQKERRLRRILWIICPAIVISLCSSMVASALTVSDTKIWGNSGNNSASAISCEIKEKNIEMANKNGSFVPQHPYVQVTYTNKGTGQAQIFVEDNEGIPINGGILVVEPEKTGVLTFSGPVKPGWKCRYNVCSKNGETVVDGILTVKTAGKREAFADPYNVNTTIIQDSKNGSFVPQSPYVKVDYKNRAISSSTVFIQDSHGNPLPDGKGIFEVGKGGEASVFLELTVGARYHYNVTTPNGATPVSGMLTVQSAGTKSEAASL